MKIFILGMLAAGMGESHVIKFLLTMGINPPSDTCLKDRQREVGHHFETLAKKTCDNAIIEEVNASKNSNSHENVNSQNDSPVSLCASVDAAWQRRGSERSYNSLSGHSSLIGEKTGKVLNYTTRKKSCRFSDTAERNGTKPREHDCRKNWQGSLKSVEPNMAIDMIKGKPDDSFQIGAVSSDLDSTLSARIKTEIGRSVEKLIDSNHLTKTLTTQLYQLKETHKELSTTFIAYLKRCFIYAVKQNDSVEEISDAISNIVNHVYGNHTNCKKWCNFSEDPESYKHKSLPRGKDLKGEGLRKALKELFRAYSANSQKLRTLGSTQSNESFNASVAFFAP